jgi:uncharacterized protein YbaA (DUF1428 family)
MTYVDGMMAPAEAESREAYTAFAKSMAAVFRDHGATRVVDCWGDDVPDGKITDMKRAVAAKAGEVVGFGWIEWPDKATRDAGWNSAMADPRMRPPGDANAGFDPKRMIYGGYAVISDL